MTPSPSTAAGGSAPLASIVLLCYGKWYLTERCLETLEEALGPALGSDFELVIVDNGSRDETPVQLEAWSDRAKIVTLSPNRHFSGGCNAGARAASGEVLIFLNNDTVIRPGVFEELVREALDPTVGAVGLRLLYPDMTVQHGGVGWFRTPRGSFHSFHLFRYEAGDLAAASAPLDVDIVTGACLAIRRELYFEVGGFDEGYASGYEDVDLCIKVRVAGYRVVYRGDLWIVHDEGLTRGRNGDESDNWALFRSRWESILDDDGATIARLFDGRFNPGVLFHAAPGASPWGTGISVEGQVGGLSGESAEARTLLARLEGLGLAPAAREWQQTWIWANLDEHDEALLTAAVKRPKRPGALVVHVPVGAWATVPPGAAHVLRIATVPPAGLPAASAVWAASPELADALVAGGLDAGCVDVLPPLLPALEAGPGGEGLLALLPSEDLQLAARLLRALAALRDVRIRLLPTVATPRLETLVHELLPGAELLAPLSREAGVAALAAECDVVLCGSENDHFDRIALHAAGVGAVPVTLRRGPAAAVLGDELVVEASASETALVGALGRALDRSSGRDARASLVAEECGPEATVDRLRRLQEAAFERLAGGLACAVR